MCNRLSIQRETNMRDKENSISQKQNIFESKLLFSYFNDKPDGLSWRSFLIYVRNILIKRFKFVNINFWNWIY